MDPYTDDWTLDGLKRLMGAIFPEAVRQAQAERDRAAREALNAYARGWDEVVGDATDLDHALLDTVVARPAAFASPLPSWRSRTPAEVAEYDRRFLHLLGIEWTPDLGAGEPRS